MAVSTTVSDSVTGTLLIQDAAELLGAVPVGVALESAQITSCLRTLNQMIKFWQTLGVTIQHRRLAYLFPTVNVSSYDPLLGSSSRYVYSHSSTTTSVASTSGTNTITLTTIGAAATTNRIGVYQSDGTMLWTTINGAPAGSVVTLTANLSADVDAGAVVYFFAAANAERPMEVLDAWVRNFDGNDTQIDVVSMNDYQSQATKTTDGQINLVCYDPQVIAPKLYVWPQPEDPRQIVILSVKRTVYDVAAAADNPDFPQEAYLPLVYNLAVLCAPKLGGSPNLQIIAPIAQELFKAYQEYAGKPDGPVRFQLNLE